MEFRFVIMPFKSVLPFVVPGSHPSKKRFKEIRETSFIITKKFGALSARLPLPLLMMSCSLKFLGMFPVFSVLVIFFSFFRITQNFIGFIDLLKFFMRLFVVRIYVRVIFSRQFPVSFLNVIC